MTGILAEEQLAGRLHIRPRVVYSSSEVLTPRTRERAKAAWGHEPFNQYAATETASIAAEHRACRRMHMFEDLVITEVVDERGRPVPPGEYGAKVLITTLFSRTQPLIRYELNDSIRVSAEPHSCHLPFAVLEGVQGRVEDTLQLPAVRGGTVAVRPLVFNRVMDILSVAGWQVVQQPDDGLVVLLVGEVDGLADERLSERLIHSLAQEGVRVPYVRVRHVAAIPKTSAGKMPLVTLARAEAGAP
jgi:phenylacetate-coenzyme A ligase PaaK-like adenylate-forming protein